MSMTLLLRNPGYPWVSTRLGSTKDSHTIIREHWGPPHHQQCTNSAQCSCESSGYVSPLLPGQKKNPTSLPQIVVLRWLDLNFLSPGSWVVQELGEWADQYTASNSIMRTLVQSSHLWKGITSGMLLLSVGPLRSERCCFLGCSKPLQTWKPESWLCFYIVENWTQVKKKLNIQWNLALKYTCVGTHTHVSK